MKLADVCACESSNLKQSDVINISGKYPVYGATGKIGYIDTYKQEKPYIAIVKDGAGVGRTYLCDSKSSVIGTLQYILPKENVLPEYLFYVIKHMHLEKYYSGATIPHIYFKNYKNEEFNLDSINNQETIINILNDCNKLINLRETQLQKYDDLIKARFVEMFGDPIRNTQKRPITELINVVKMQRGFDLPVQERQQDGEIPVFGSNGALDHHNVAKVKGGGVITGRSGTIGNVYYTEGDYWPLNTSLFSVDTHGNNIVYLAYLLTMYDLSRFTEGTGVPTLNRNKFHDKPIIDVSLVEQKKFADFVQQVDKSKFLCFHQKKIRETFKVSRKLIFLLKFYSACRLWCEIIQYTVDTSNFMSNTLSNMNHNFMWNFSNSFCHNVNRAYCTNNTAPFKSTFTIFNTSRLSYFFRKYFNHLFRFTLTK